MYMNIVWFHSYVIEYISIMTNIMKLVGDVLYRMFNV